MERGRTGNREEGRAGGAQGVADEGRIKGEEERRRGATERARRTGEPAGGCGSLERLDARRGGFDTRYRARSLELKFLRWPTMSSNRFLSTLAENAHRRADRPSRIRKPRPYCLSSLFCGRYDGWHKERNKIERGEGFIIHERGMRGLIISIL